MYWSSIHIFIRHNLWTLDKNPGKSSWWAEAKMVIFWMFLGFLMTSSKMEGLWYATFIQLSSVYLLWKSDGRKLKEANFQLICMFCSKIWLFRIPIKSMDMKLHMEELKTRVIWLSSKWSKKCSNILKAG